jgi:hypothetical protein
MLVYREQFPEPHAVFKIEGLFFEIIQHKIDFIFLHFITPQHNGAI